MADWMLPMTGGCRCGQVRFEITAPPMFTGICHCIGCQKMTGGAYSASVAVPLNGFAVTAGEVEIGGLHGERLHHRHCAHCKSWVYTDFEPATGFINVRAMMLDNPSWFTPFIESYTSEALPWALVGSATHSFEKFPSMEQYQPLLAEFAAR
jgi:hypothetical protein